MTWKQALTRAINAEGTALQTRAQAEGEWRAAWWATTWALAEVPRAEWADAQDTYTRRTEHSKVYCDKRRRIGTRLTETILGYGLPQPRFAEAVVNWIGKDTDPARVAEAVKLLAEAEKEEMSLREFSLAITGRPWVRAQENMTESEQDAIVEHVAKKRPEKVAAIVTENRNARVATKRATRAVEAKEVDDALARAGISKAQREKRKSDLKDRLRQGSEAIGKEWEATPPNERGAMTLLMLMSNLVGAAEALDNFASEENNTDAVWSPDDALDAIDLIDEVYEKNLAHAKLMFQARIDANAGVPAEWVEA